MSNDLYATRHSDPLKLRLRRPFQRAQSIIGVPLVFQDDEHADIFVDYFAATVDELDKVVSSAGAAPAGIVREWLMKLAPEQQRQLILGLFSGPLPDFFAAAGKVIQSHKTHINEKSA